MTATIMDGKALAASIKVDLRMKVERLEVEGIRPKLATLLVGDDEASRVYIASKHRVAAEVGINSENLHLPGETREDELASLIRSLNASPEVTGILLQLPLPPHLEPRSMIELISPEKDVDGLTNTNMGRLLSGRGALVPCTPLGVMELIHHYGVAVEGAHAVIVNRSSLVGKPLLHLLVSEDATVSVCHSKSRDLGALTREADILVSAVGRAPRFRISSEMVKEGATVIDVAMNRVEGRLVGDVDFDKVKEKASYITPVPGGVGPMTVVMLMRNTLLAAEILAGKKGALELQRARAS